MSRRLIDQPQRQQIQVRLAPALYDRIKILAVVEHRTYNGQVVHLLERIIRTAEQEQHDREEATR